MEWIVVVSVLLGFGTLYGGAQLLQRETQPREPPIPPARTANAAPAPRAKAWIKQLLPGGARRLRAPQTTLRQATVYRRKRLYLFHADSQTTEGVWILWKPVFTLEDTSADRDLGLAVRAALDGSRSRVRHPKKLDSLTEPLLRHAGAKSWNEFAKSAICTGIQEDGERIVLVPTWSGGPKEGFVEDSSRKRILERASPEELGAALRRAMS